jgi:hypothetical protein
MSELIPVDRLEFVRRFHSRKTEGVNLKNFDPVSLAADMIVIWAANGIGPDDLCFVARECPICFFDTPQWIEKASHDSGELWQQMRSI